MEFIKWHVWKTIQKKINISLLIFLIVLKSVSCSRKKITVDEIISKYDIEDFSCLYKFRVALRGGTYSTVIYMIGKKHLDCPPYGLVIDKKYNKIMEIKRDNVYRCCNDYYSDHEFYEFLRCYRKYRFVLFSMDGDSNIVMKYGSHDDKFLLRLPKHSTSEDTVLDKRYYKHYRGRWYIEGYRNIYE